MWMKQQILFFLTLSEMKLGEIFVPKMKQYKLKDLASKVSKNHKIIGLRQGEKLEEILITKDELKRASTHKKYVDNKTIFKIITVFMQLFT